MDVGQVWQFQELQKTKNAIGHGMMIPHEAVKHPDLGVCRTSANLQERAAETSLDIAEETQGSGRKPRVRTETVALSGPFLDISLYVCNEKTPNNREI